MTRGGRPPKLTPEQVRKARVMVRAGMTTDRAASSFGVSGSTLRRYLRGECKHHKRTAA